MKTLLLAITALLTWLPLHAATLKLDGDLRWDVTPPRCSFQLKGNLQNVGTSSGTLKMVLWASPNPFPSAGYTVGEATLGTLASGYQYASFTNKCEAKLPVVTGKLYFTILVSEYTSAGWRNIFAEPTGTRQIKNGKLVGQKKWTIPSAPAIPPLGKLQAGMQLRLQTKATGEMNLFPSGFQDRTVIKIKSKNLLESKLRTTTQKANYSHQVKSGRFNKQRVDYSHVVIDYGSDSTTTLSLYFQNTLSGTFKSVEANSGGSETTWGTFKLF